MSTVLPVVIVIANIIDFAAAMVQIASGVVKEKNKILFFQTLQISMQTVSMCLLQAYTGAVSNLISVVRNVLAVKEKLYFPVKLVLIAAQLALTIIFGDGTIVAWLPFIVCTVYILLMDLKDPIAFKILVTATFVPWVIYYFVYRSYTGAFFAAATIIANIVSLRRMILDRKAEKAEEVSS